MSELYGQDPVTPESVEGSITVNDTNGNNIVEVNNAKDDDSWMFKLRDAGDIVPKEANTEAFKTFNRTFAAIGGTPTEEQRILLDPILQKLFALGFTNRCKDIGFSEEFYSWVETKYARNEYFLTYKKKGIKFKPTLTEVDEDAIAIALSAKLTRFPNTDVTRFNTWKDIAKNMLGLNTHISLGADLESPLTFIIFNTPGGEEPGDRIDFDTIGFNVDMLTLAGKYNIPSFNINKEGGLKRLEDFIATF